MSSNSGKLFFIAVGAAVLLYGNVAADIFRQNAFLYGNNIEVGIGSDGAFGSEINSPEIGRKSYGNKLGYISDPSGNRFQTNYHGDFFLPGIPEEGWGIAFDNKIYNNNRNQQGAEISGALSDYIITPSTQRVTWKGTIAGLEITQTFRVYIDGTAIVIDVTLKNTTDTQMNNVYYMRTVDPDNNAEQNPESGASKFATTNTILSQGTDGKGISAVSAMQGEKPGFFTKSLLTLNGYGENSRVTYGGMSNRKPVEVYEGLAGLKQSGSKTADEAISLAFKFDVLEPKDSVTFRAGYQLKDVPVPSIDIDGDNSSGATGNAFEQLYILGSDPVSLTDTDIAIDVNELTRLKQAIITITNPHEKDSLEVLGTLPDGISSNETESPTTELRLSGLASKEDYQIALKQIVFSNADAKSRIDPRSITLQIIDENATPSNAAVSIVNVTTPVTLDNPVIADDDAINDDEVTNLGFSGHAAPNAEVIVGFTDKNGKKLAPAKIVTADENGKWSIEADPANLNNLSDGLIKINISATDSNGNIATLDKNIIKDTVILLDNITPVDNEVVASTTPTYQGKTDPTAAVSLKILPDGKTYNTIADDTGAWKIPLDKFAMGVTQGVKITAEDKYQNKTSQTLTFKTPNLPIEVTDLDADEDGVAHSTTPTIKGTSNPNTVILIEMVTLDSQKTSCSTTTNSEGNWSCKLPISPTGGPYSVTVTATDEANNHNSTTRTLSIPALTLSISSPSDNQLVENTTPLVKGATDPGAMVKLEVLPAGKTYTTTADATGNWSIQLDDALPKGKTVSIKVTATDAANNQSTLIQRIQIPSLDLKVIDLDVNEQGMASSTTPTIKGSSEPNTNIHISMPTTGGNTFTCDTISDANGDWHCTMPVSLSGGPYNLTVTATDSEGNSTAITKQISIPELPLIIDSPANNAVISGANPVITGTSKPGTQIKVMVSNGSSCHAITDETNHWRCQLPELAFDHDYTLTVTTEDGKGNQTSKTLDISTDKLPLAIITPQDNSTTEDTTPLFIGTSTSNTAITVTAAGGQRCTAKADADGRWSCELPAMPVGGPYSVTIKAEDSHGNQTTITEAIYIPAIPLIISAPTEGEMIKASNVMVTGTSDPNTAIKVLGPDGELCETTSDASGAWRCQLEDLQSGNNKHITVISGDNQKVAIRQIDIENSSEKVKTVLSGSPSLIMLLLLGLLVRLKFYQGQKIKSESGRIAEQLFNTVDSRK